MKNKVYIATLLISVGSCSCGKSKWLQENPSGSFIKPTTIDHCYALVNNRDNMGGTPVMGEISADDYLLADSNYNRLTALEQNLYKWQKDIYGNTIGVQDWDRPYQQLYTLNLVLETLETITPATDSARTKWKETKGYALFMRSFLFHNLAQVFAPPYDTATPAKLPGIVLLLHTNNDVLTRSDLYTTYQTILTDLKEAKKLLPKQLSPVARNLPCRQAADALIARVYLTMHNYPAAGQYADSCLQQGGELMNYNLLTNSTDKPRFLAENQEVLYQSFLLEGTLIKAWVGTNCTIVPGLYEAYDNNDLRKSIFFAKNKDSMPYYKNSYTASITAFSGLALDEVILIRAEAKAVEGKLTDAMNDLNALLGNRFRTGSYINQIAADKTQALALIRAERRKELVFRGLHWQDLRRWNKEGAEDTLTRVIGGLRYQLLPNHKNYTLPIPADALAGTQIEQNSRE